MIATSIVLLLLALLGAPLFAVIAASALLGFQREGIDLSVVAIEIYRLAEMPALVAIPLFTFAGIPAWLLETIIPFAFGAIALRYGKLAVVEAQRALRPAPENADDAPGTDRR